MSDHEEDMRMARENPGGFLEVHSDEELNSSFILLGWQYLQIVDRARREFARKAIGYFQTKQHEYGNEDAFAILLGYLKEEEEEADE